MVKFVSFSKSDPLCLISRGDNSIDRNQTFMVLICVQMIAIHIDSTLVVTLILTLQCSQSKYSTLLHSTVYTPYCSESIFESVC